MGKDVNFYVFLSSFSFQLFILLPFVSVSEGGEAGLLKGQCQEICNPKFVLAKLTLPCYKSSQPGQVACKPGHRGSFNKVDRA